MAVHGTENFVYYTDRILGAGSTGTVYFGRHKRRGDACAVKLFASNTGSRTKAQVRENELEFMRRLQHKNIVMLLAIEKDTKTSDVALIMELCSEGSLQKRLSEPEFVHGLRESDCIIFITQFVSGFTYLRLHGISHRDIKPGNILCNRQEDGLIIYKITDFGSSRELLGEDKSKALYGTEEYLHPAVYECVFITKSHYGSEFESHAELWSIGVTFFQVATGRLPFQVVGGRSNRETMYGIISRKPSGIISTVQKSGSTNFEESRDLPVTCTYSQGFKNFLVPLIAGLLEKDFTKQMTFESFFSKCEEQESMLVVHVFCVITSVCHNVCVRRTDTYDTFRLTVERMSRISVSLQFLVYNKVELTEITGTDGMVQSFPKTSPDDPILLAIIGSPIPQDLRPDLLPLFDIPNASTERNLNTDAMWARDACAYFIRCLDNVNVYKRIQRLTALLKESLIEILTAKHARLKMLRAEMESHFALISFNSRTCSRLLDLKLSEASQSTSGSTDSMKSFRQKSTSIERKAALLQEVELAKTNSVRQINDGCDELVQGKRLIDELLRKLDLTHVLEKNVDESGCESHRCLSKVQFNVKHGKTVYEQFTKDRRRQLTHNEEQIHKYEKMKLEQRVKRVSSMLITHCYSKTTLVNEEFRRWLLEIFNPAWNHINQIENNLDKVKCVMTELTSLIKEKYEFCAGKLRGLMPESGLKEPLKSSGYHSQTRSTSLRDSLATTTNTLPDLKNQLRLINQCYEDVGNVVKHFGANIKENETILRRLEDS